MAIVSVQGVTKQYGTQIVLDQVSFELHHGETVGLIGANGAGKTTLFRTIAGEITPDNGTVTTAKGLGVGYLKQEPEVALDTSLHDEVGGAFADLLEMERRLHDFSDQMAAAADNHELLTGLMGRYERVNARFIAAGGHTFETRLNEILGGLGFSQADRAKPMSLLSGGEKCRAALAKLLLRDHRLLLLDEPTNHLDIDAVRWLEKFLANHQGTALIVSHDRYLLDRLCTRIIELDRCRVASYPGNYSNFAQVKELRLLTQQRQHEQDATFIAKERAFIAKHLATQRTKEAKGRRKRLERRLGEGEFVTDAPPSQQRSAKIEFNEAKVRTNTVVRGDGLCMAFDEKQLFKNLTFQIQPSQRQGITGPNGTGKTTLLNIILGKLAPTGGTFELDTGLGLGYYAQEEGVWNPEHTVLDEIRNERVGFTELAARSYLGRFRFTGDDVFKTLGQLSGGERSRVRLIKLILQQPDLLILDEPTNHLDIPSREALEAALEEYQGTIIVVSHDRYFLDRIADRLLVIRDTGPVMYEGNYSFYIQQVEQKVAQEREKTATAAKKARKAERGKEKAKPKSSRFDLMSIHDLEALVIELEEKLASLHMRFGDADVCKDPDLLAELKEDAEAVEAELAETNAAWEERAEYQ